MTAAASSGAGHVVYEAVGPRGQIMYVGASQNFHERMKGHKDDSQWWGTLDHFRVTPCRDRVEALEYESTLIARHQPPFNVKGTVKPERERGSITTDILRLLREQGPLTTRQVRDGLGDYKNAGTYLKHLEGQGMVVIAGHVPGRGGKNGVVTQWAVPVAIDVAA